MPEKIKFGKFLLEVKASDDAKGTDGNNNFFVMKTKKEIDENGNGYSSTDCLNREDIEELIKDGIKYRELKKENQ